MAFCGNCGSPINGGKFCPKCGASLEQMSIQKDAVYPSTFNQKPPSRIVGIIGALVVAVVLMLVLTKKSSLANEPCDYCNRSPSMAFETSDGSMAYVCKECSKECMICHKKATKHYENLIGTIVFVCDDCYKEVTDD